MIGPQHEKSIRYAYQGLGIPRPFWLVKSSGVGVCSPGFSQLFLPCCWNCVDDLISVMKGVGHMDGFALTLPEFSWWWKRWPIWVSSSEPMERFLSAWGRGSWIIKSRNMLVIRWEPKDRVFFAEDILLDLPRSDKWATKPVTKAFRQITSHRSASLRVIPLLVFWFETWGVEGVRGGPPVVECCPRHKWPTMQGRSSWVAFLRAVRRKPYRCGQSNMGRP